MVACAQPGSAVGLAPILNSIDCPDQANDKIGVIAEGEAVTCIADAGSSSLQRTCAATTKYSCPDGNGDNSMLPFLIQSVTNQKDIKCSVCGLDTDGDLDPRTNQYRVTINFGPLDQNPVEGTARVSEELGGVMDDRIDGYKVFMTDMYGRVQGQHLADVPALKKGPGTGNDNCCNPNEYSVTVTGNQPSALPTMYFMVVPYKGNFILPMGRLTTGVTDKSGSAAETGTATIIKALVAFLLSGAGIEEMKNNPAKAKVIAQRVIAESTPADITMAMIKIIDIIYPTGGRRLEDGRRLANHGESVKIEFEIFVPADSQATFDAEDIDKTTFATRLKETVKDVLDADITVSEITAEVTETSTVQGEQPTSAAFPGAKLPSSLMVFIIMLAGKQVLA